jgi:apolipoprotein N-acyltransferase
VVPSDGRRRVARIASALTAGAVVGWLAWGDGRAPALALLVPLVWMLIRDQPAAAAWVAGYYCTSMRGVIYASDVFFSGSHPFVFGLGLWVGLSVLLCLPWVVSAFVRNRGKAVHGRFWGALALISILVAMVPPLGMVNAASPILGLGWVVPGAGWAAITAYAVLIMAFPFLKHQSIVVGVLAVLSLALTPYQGEDHSRLGDIVAVSTRWGQIKSMDMAVDRITAIGIEARKQTDSGAKAIIFPELILGDWNDSYQSAWDMEIAKASKRRNMEIAVGVAVEDSPGVMANTLKLVHKGETRSVHARQTVPVSMYQPWHDTGYPSNWSKSSVLEVAGKRAMVLFCYEEHLAGLMLMGLLRDRPDFILAVSNSWWGGKSASPAVQLRHSESIAKLFGLPLLRANNT